MKGGARPGSGRKPTLIDERRVLVLREQGESMQKIAERFNVSLQVIKYFFKKRRKQHGNDPRSQSQEGSQATAR
jgi:transposase